MAFFLSIFYIALTYLSPDEILPALSPFRPLLVTIILALLASIPSILRPGTAIRRPQTLLLMGFVFTVMMSQVVHGWFGGALFGLQIFLPSAIVYFLVAANVTTWRKLTIAIFVTVAAALFMLCESLNAYHFHPENRLFLFRQPVYEGWKLVEIVIRINGVGFLNDPNDFAQYLLTMLPFLGLAWKKKKFFRNMVVVGIPAGLILYGIFLTHSRGALLGLGVMMLFALREKLGNTGSTALTVMALFAMLALNFTGNRGISMEQGYGRLDAWSTGLGLFKTHPIFGVGFNGFLEYHDITAHNSFVLCFTELGLVGYTFWMAFIVTTLLDLNAVIDAKEPPAEPQPENVETLAAAAGDGDAEFGAALGIAPRAAFVAPLPPGSPTPANIKRWARLIRLSLITFLATAWFLSRTYVVTLYLIVGLAVVVTQLAKEAGLEVTHKLSWPRVTMISEFATIALVYATVVLSH